MRKMKKLCLMLSFVLAGFTLFAPKFSAEINDEQRAAVRELLTLELQAFEDSNNALIREIDSYNGQYDHLKDILLNQLQLCRERFREMIDIANELIDRNQIVINNEQNGELDDSYVIMKVVTQASLEYLTRHPESININ